MSRPTIYLESLKLDLKIISGEFITPYVRISANDREDRHLTVSSSSYPTSIPQSSVLTFNITFDHSDIEYSSIIYNNISSRIESIFSIFTEKVNQSYRNFYISKYSQSAHSLNVTVLLNEEDLPEFCTYISEQARKFYDEEFYKTLENIIK